MSSFLITYLHFCTCVPVLLITSLPLGTHISTSVLHLLATMLVLMRMVQLLAPTIALAICSDDMPDDDSQNFPDDEQPALRQLLTDYSTQIYAGCNFYEATARKYPLVYATLELGTSWGHVVCKMLGISGSNNNPVRYLLQRAHCLM